jgi:hypothetical protein
LERVRGEFVLTPESVCETDRGNGTLIQAENRLLKDRLRGKRIRFTDAERSLLARKAKAVGRKALLKLDTVVSPDTLLRRDRQFLVS